MPQNVVSSGAMEIEVEHHEMGRCRWGCVQWWVVRDAGDSMSAGGTTKTCTAPMGSRLYPRKRQLKRPRYSAGACITAVAQHVRAHKGYAAIRAP